MLLAVDTSTTQIGISLYDGVQVMAEMQWRSQHHHTVELAPAVSDLVARTGLTIAEIQALGVALGPGSFTSLRVGLAFVKGLSLARHIPVIGVPTLDILAAAQELQKLPLVAVLQAGRGRLAVGWYKATEHGWQKEGSPQVRTVDELAGSINKPTIICGELSGEERQRLARKRVNVQLASPVASLRRPAVLAELAWERWQAQQVDEVDSLAPIYLHVSDPIPS
jgi:tRNA threonylcarbamoyladenosine biosynthesis protein TsaB